MPWSACQPIGQATHDDGLPGIACRSAASAKNEELAVFDTHSGEVREGERLTFAEWYWNARS